MAKYNATDIVEILVTLSDGRQFIYKDKGILSLRRTLNTISVKPPVTIIQEDEFEDEHSEQEDTPPRTRRGNTEGGLQRPQTANGYNVVPLSYTAQKGGMSPMDIAKDLQRQAEAASGVRY